MVKVVVITKHAKFEQVVKDKATAVQFKNDVEAGGRMVLSYSITEETPEKVERLPEGYQ